MHVKLKHFIMLYALLQVNIRVKDIYYSFEIRCKMSSGFK